MWLTTWKIVAFVLNGLAFILIGQALPDVIEGFDSSSLIEAVVLALVVAAATHRDPVRLGVPLELSAELAAPDAREA